MNFKFSRMNVYAKDGHNPEMYDVAIVVVTVVDVNDNAPHIGYPSEHNFTVSLKDFYSARFIIIKTIQLLTFLYLNMAEYHLISVPVKLS